jgi:hypothetical protein
MQEDTAWAAAPTTRCVQTRRCLPLLPLKNGHAEKAREERRPESLLHPGAVSAGRVAAASFFFPLLIHQPCCCGAKGEQSLQSPQIGARAKVCGNLLT